MPYRSANIDSPEIIKQFRKDFLAFDRTCREALSGIKGDIARTIEWLKHEQLWHWKQQLRKRQQLVNVAKSEYRRAQYAMEGIKKSSCLDEKKALEKAERHKEEAEKKIQVIEKWIPILERKAEELIGPCIWLSTLIDDLTPKAIVRLDRMIDNLDEYFRSSSANAVGPSSLEE